MSGSAGPATRRRIIAFGGGGFTDGGQDSPLEDYVVSMLDSRAPRICLLPTAGGDPDEQVSRFNLAFRARGCEPSHIALFRLGSEPVDIREHLLSQDAIYVGGGSMLNLLAIWRAHGVDAILREAWMSGVLLAGVSAGSMCWFEKGITSSHGRPASSEGLGLLPGSNSVHFDSQPERRVAYRAAVRAGIPGGFGVDDGVGLRFEKTTLAEVVTARPGSRAYRVEMRGGEVAETPLEPTLLPGAGEEPGASSIADFRLERERRQAWARSGRRQ
jgi:peptidase E